MVRSMVVVLLPVAFIAGLVGLLRPSSETIRDVDWEPALDAAREAAPYEVLGPDDVPPTWTATRVSYEAGVAASDGVWRMNFVTGSGTYVGLVQRQGEVDAVVRLELPDAEPDGTSSLDGQTWDRYVEEAGDDPDRALVDDRGDAVVIVLGSGGYSELEEFASSLR